MIRPLLTAAALLLPTAASTQARDADAITPDYNKTQAALRYLLAAAATPAASGAHCGVPGTPRPTIGDHLAGVLAGMDSGVNVIAGECVSGRCRVRISHPDGEAPFNWEYRFRIANGRVVPGSLGCFGA